MRDVVRFPAWACGCSLLSLASQAWLHGCPVKPSVLHGLPMRTRPIRPSASSSPIQPPQESAALTLTICPFAQEDAGPKQWLLPLMRQHVRGARLAFWATQLLPLARQLGNQAAAAAASDQLLALQCQSWEAQLWDCLPAFADAALDLADAFR